MKGGTAELRSLLFTHPYLTGPPQEVHFFDRYGLRDSTAKHWQRVFLNEAWEMTEEAAKNGVKTFEKSPSYMWVIPTAKRMKESLPSLKLISLLRHPTARAYSQYWHDCHKSSKKALERVR